MTSPTKEVVKLKWVNDCSGSSRGHWPGCQGCERLVILNKSEIEFVKSVAYQKGHFEGYKKGIEDEIRCVETSGEHFDLQKLLTQKGTK